LKLANNDLGDASVAGLASLAALRVLDLYGNRHITDGSLEALEKSNGLLRVYLWQTNASLASIKRVNDEHGHVHVFGGIEAAAGGKKL
jgi:hypothetical protein